RLKQAWQEKAEPTKRIDTTSSTSSRKIVPYEQTSGTSNNGLHGANEKQSARSGEGISARGTKRLASTIVTPSRDDGIMECDMHDEDLLGLDLKEMEDSEAQPVVSMRTTEHGSSGPSTKVSKSSRQGTKANVPLSFQHKKFEILRRGSPRKSSSSSQGAHMARDSS
ncbi:hypothetical protein HID58_069438, partial [Brassica napus]